MLVCAPCPTFARPPMTRRSCKRATKTSRENRIETEFETEFEAVFTRASPFPPSHPPCADTTCSTLYKTPQHTRMLSAWPQPSTRRG